MCLRTYKEMLSITRTTVIKPRQTAVSAWAATTVGGIYTDSRNELAEACHRHALVCKNTCALRDWLTDIAQMRAHCYCKEKKKEKEADLYSAFIEVPYTQGAQVRITQCYLQTTPYLPLPRKHSPDGASQTEVADI